jgi:hypothetical protein
VDSGSGQRERLDERLGPDTDLLGTDRAIRVQTPREPRRVVEREAATVGARIDGMPLPPVWPSGLTKQKQPATGTCCSIRARPARTAATCRRMPSTSPARDNEHLVAEDVLPYLDLAFEALGVDDEEAGGRDRDVVDVGAAPRHGAVVENRDVETIRSKVFGHGLPADRARAPGALVGGWFAAVQQEVADMRVCLAGGGLAGGAAAVVLAAGGCGRGAWMAPMGFDERSSAVSRLNWNRFGKP